MKKPLLYAFTLTALGGCFYTEPPYGRTAVLDLPVHSQTTINKTVTVNAPPGTTVIYQDSEPVHRYGYPSTLPAPVSRASDLPVLKNVCENNRAVAILLPKVHVIYTAMM